VDINTIEHDLITKFEATPANAKSIVARLQAGESITVKRDITHAKAERFCQRLEALGLICLVHEELSLAPIEPEKEECICPACGHKQVKATQSFDQCERCGVVHQNYKALLARKQLIEAEKQKIRQRLKGAREYRQQKKIMIKEIEQEKASQSLLESARQEALRQIRKESGLTGFGYLRAMIAAADTACYRLRVRAATANTSFMLLAGFLIVGMLSTIGYVLYSHVLNPSQTGVAETSQPATPLTVTATQVATANPVRNPKQVQVPNRVTPTTGDAHPTDIPAAVSVTTSMGVAETSQPATPPTVTATQVATANPARSPKQVQVPNREVTPATGDAHPTDIPAAVSVTIAADLAKAGQVEAAQHELTRVMKLAQSKQNLSESELDAVAFGQTEIFGDLGVQQFRQNNRVASSKSLAQASIPSIFD
jgi:hypothetical protein